MHAERTAGRSGNGDFFVSDPFGAATSFADKSGVALGSEAPGDVGWCLQSDGAGLRVRPGRTQGTCLDVLPITGAEREVFHAGHSLLLVSFLLVLDLRFTPGASARGVPC